MSTQIAAETGARTRKDRDEGRDNATATAPSELTHPSRLAAAGDIGKPQP